VLRTCSCLAGTLVVVLMSGAPAGAERLASSAERRAVLQVVPPTTRARCVVVSISVLALSTINPARYAGVRSCGPASDGTRRGRGGRRIPATFGLILQQPEDFPYWSVVVSGTRLGGARCARIVAKATAPISVFLRRNVLYDLDLTFFAMGCKRGTLYGTV